MEDSGIKVDEHASSKVVNLAENGHTVMIVAFKNEIIGLISVMDIPRKTAAATLMRLKEIGIKHMIMLTGDHQNVGMLLLNKLDSQMLEVTYYLKTKFLL